MSTRARLVIAVAMMGIAVVVLVWMSARSRPEVETRDSARSAAPGELSSPPRATGAAPKVDAMPSASAPSAPTGTANAPPSSTPPAKLALASPREAVETQLRLLSARDDETFRRTFLPEVQPDLTDQAVEGCRRRVGSRKVKPDWEVAEESVERTDAGAQRRVLRVSMFGKSMTGFHEVAPGEWLADAVWCVPIW